MHQVLLFVDTTNNATRIVAGGAAPGSGRLAEPAEHFPVPDLNRWLSLAWEIVTIAPAATGLYVALRRRQARCRSPPSRRISRLRRSVSRCTCRSGSVDLKGHGR